MLKYTLLTLLLGCGSDIASQNAALQTQPFGPINTTTYDAAHGVLPSTTMPLVTGPLGTPVWQARAAFDWLHARQVYTDVTYTLPIRDPKAESNILSDLVFRGQAWPNQGAKHTCTADGVAGDEVRDDNGNVVCVTPALTFDITDAAGMVLFERFAPSPVPPVDFGHPMPKGTEVLATGDQLILRLHVRGTMQLRTSDVRASVAETTNCAKRCHL